MRFERFAQLSIAGARRLNCSIRQILPDARRALRKPAAIGCIILTAHRAQITLVILLVFMILLAPTAVDFLTGKIFPPETSKKVFGIIKTHRVNPLKEFSDVVIMTALWLASIASTLLLLWFHIPHGLARANARARRLLLAGDRHSDINRSRTLYKLAFAIVTDPELESESDARLRESVISPTSSLSPGTANADSRRDPIIGSDTLIQTFQPSLQNEIFKSQSSLDRRYILGQELGRGAMGAVFQARDKVLDREVAVKQLYLVLSGDEEYASRFRREARALARLTHPNIVQVYDLIEDGGRLWMVLEYVAGGDLASYLKDKGRLSVDEVAKIVIPVAQGLAFAHDQGIVHRDLKPANILLTGECDPKISDFGIAKLSQSNRLTQVGSVLGSPPYMSPEQCSGGTVDTRTDIYALGITLYELLSGKKPFEGETSSVLARQIVEQPPPLSEYLDHLPGQVEDLILRMLAKDPDNRPSDLTEVIDSLSEYRDRVLSA